MAASKKEKSNPTTKTVPQLAGASPSSHATSPKKTSAPKEAPDAVTLLKTDHQHVLELFSQYESASELKKKRQLAQQICVELIHHTALEEELFYPACREHGVEDGALDEAQVEHDAAKLLIAELLGGDPGEEYYDAKVAVLREEIKHHIKEEEEPTHGILARSASSGVDMSALGQQLQARKQELETAGVDPRPPQPVSFHFASANFNEDRAMASQYRDRDERGRFEHNDDRNNGGRSRNGGQDRDAYGRFESDDRDSGRYSRSRDDDGGNRGYGRNSGQERGRDEYGRFESDDRDSGRYSRSRDDDDDRGYSRGGGQERSRDEYGRFESDDRKSSRYGRSRQEDDDRGNGRGWYGDPRGHSEASREGWRNRDDYQGARSGNYSRSSTSRDDDDDRGGRGWFGDPQGHSDASREGWRDRDGDRGARGSSSSRSSRSHDDDDGRRGGHGGWFGDSRGHSEASRRGWQNR